MLLAEILNSLEQMVNILQQSGFDPLKQQYVDNWLHSNQEVCS